MKKITAVCICGLMAAALTTGCGKKAAIDGMEPGEYKGISYTPVPVEVTDEQVEAEIQGLLDEHVVETGVDRAAKEGDITNIDFVDTKDGVAFEGGTSSDYDPKPGSGSSIDGFEDGPIDAVEGQELSLNLMFSDLYPNNEELTGQDVVFDVTVSAVEELKLARLNDILVRENTEPATVDKYRRAAREDLPVAARVDADNRKKSEIFQEVMDSLEIIVTDATVDACYNEQLSNYESQTSQAGTDLETMVNYYDSDLDTLKSQLRAMSEEASERNPVVKAIAGVRGTAIMEGDKNALATEFGYADKDDMAEVVGDTIVNNYILTKKVISLIADSVVET